MYRFHFPKLPALVHARSMRRWLLSSAALVLFACTNDTARIVSESGAAARGPAGPSSVDPALGVTGSTESGPDGTPAVAFIAADSDTSAPGSTGVVAMGVSEAEGIGAALGASDTGATDAASAASGSSPCWALPVVTRARVLAAPGQGAALVGGKIVASNTSATNGFVDLASISTAPSEGTWLELSFDNTTPYRYVKYYGPTGSYGSLAELELYSAESRLTGAAFGSAGSRDASGNVFERALDGDPSTWFEGPQPSDEYVGLDLAAGHVTAAPAFSPGPANAAPGASVSLSAEAGASITYSTDGRDPRSDGLPYTGPISLPAGPTLLKAAATRQCALPSEVTQAVYGAVANAAPGQQSSVQSSMHIGNSLTDTIVDTLETLASDGGITLDFNRYTIPGAGTWLYDTNPTGGFGVANVQEALRTRPFDHISMQPYPNLPCQALPSSDGPDSDSGYLDEAWDDARTQNPNVQFWVYQQWPAPTDFDNCITGGTWTRADWQPPTPMTWEDAVANELSYQEVVRAELARLNPEAPPPYIVPGGLALVALKQAVEAGSVPGINDFFGRLFNANGTDIHLTGAGAYYISLVFYACMFQQNPEGLINDSEGELTSEQALVFQRLAWQTVTGYPLAGIGR
jgi:chitobiase/beta-hexosaminidase-like protein